MLVAATLLVPLQSSQQPSNGALPPLSPSSSSSSSSVPLPPSLGGKTRLKSRVAHKLKLMYREAKAWTSSDFEAALLKSTRPDDRAPKAKHVESIALSVSAFEAFAAPDCDPYALLFHKIWSRLVEASPYTVTKAIYLYRRVLFQNSKLFKARETLHSQHSTKSKTPYFDRHAVLEVEVEQGLDVLVWQHFIARYWTYVDRAWVACARANERKSPPNKKQFEKHDYEEEARRVKSVAKTAAELVSLASTVFFSKKHDSLHKRTLPKCPLVDACILQLIEDIYALHFVLLFCFSIDPIATLDGAKDACGTAFWYYHRLAIDQVHNNNDAPPTDKTSSSPHPRR